VIVGMSAYMVAISANEFDAKPAGSLDHGQTMSASLDIDGNLTIS
jgi:hypothetical protein